MTKTLVISSAIATLKSVQLIVASLEQAYAGDPGRSVVLWRLPAPPPRLTGSDWCVVVVHPHGLLAPEWEKALGREQIGEVRLHLFGDFLKQASLSASTFARLTGVPARVLAPSRAFLRHVQSFFVRAEHLQLCPFEPGHVFSAASAADRLRLKELRGFAGKRVLLYAGRLAPQKNVELAAKLCQSLGADWVLLAVGRGEEHDFPVVGERASLGHAFTELQRVPRDHWAWWPDASAQDLADAFGLADAFVSLSTFHDEECGLAAREALGAGLPLVLTRWGGHIDVLEEFPSQSCAVSVSQAGERLELDLGAALEFLRQLPADARAAGARWPSVEESVRSLEATPVELFAGVTDAYLQLARQQKNYFYRPAGGLDVERYRKIYRDFGLCD